MTAHKNKQLNAIWLTLSHARGKSENKTASAAASDDDEDSQSQKRSERTGSSASENETHRPKNASRTSRATETGIIIIGTGNRALRTEH